MTNRGVMWRTIGFVLSIIILFAIVLDVLDRAQKNKIAVEKSCVLLNNAIIRSGAAGGGPSRILIEEILRNAQQHHRAYVVVQYQNALKQTRQLTLVNCQEVARNPENIKADPLPAAPRSR